MITIVLPYEVGERCVHNPASGTKPQKSYELTLRCDCLPTQSTEHQQSSLPTRIHGPRFRYLSSLVWTLMLPFHCNYSSRKYWSVTLNISPPGVLAEKEVACDCILLYLIVLNVNGKLILTYNGSRLVDLKRKFSPEINFFLHNVFDVT